MTTITATERPLRVRETSTATRVARAVRTRRWTIGWVASVGAAVGVERFL